MRAPRRCSRFADRALEAAKLAGQHQTVCYSQIARSCERAVAELSANAIRERTATAPAT